MRDSFDELEPPDPRSILYRVVEGLTVVALLVAVVMWQSDGTLQAARQLIAGTEEPAAPVVVAMRPRSSDIRLIRPGSGEIDPVETGSIATPAPRSPQPQMPTPRAVVPAGAPAAERPQPRGWQAACDGPKQTFCTASQTLSQADDPLVETSWTIERGANGLYGVWTTPTSVLVSRGMVLIMGDGNPKTVPFSACGPHSCEVRARLAGDFVELLRRSQRVSTEIVLKSGKTVSFTFSPDGLEQALDRLGV